MNKFILPILLFLISFLYMSIGLNYGISQHDEGAFAYGAVRILQGEIPYRDFWTFYPPGQYYALAFLFKIFGKSLILIRIYSIILQSFIAVSVYLLAKKLVDKNIYAIIPAVLSILYIQGPVTYGYYSYPIIPAVLFSILSCVAFIKFISCKKNIFLICSGILGGSVTLFRQDIGFYTFLAETLILIILYKNFSEFLKYLIGNIIILLPVSIFFICNVNFNELMSDLIIFPVLKYPQYRFLPYPSPTPVSETLVNIIGNNTILYKFVLLLEYVPFYLPFIIYPFAIIILLQMLKKTAYSEQLHNEKIKLTIFLLFILLGIAFFNQARIRSDSQHVIPTNIIGIIISSWIYSKLGTSAGRAVALSKLLKIIVIFLIIPLIFLSFGFESIKSKLSYLVRTYRDELAPLELNVSKNIVTIKNIAGQINDAVRFVQSKTTHTEKIFVSNKTHNRTFVTDMMFYFLSERNSATKYYDLHPGLATTSDVQKKIIDELNKFNVRYIVVWDEKTNVIEPNKSAENSGCFELDNFISNNFMEIKKICSYTILEKK